MKTDARATPRSWRSCRKATSVSNRRRPSAMARGSYGLTNPAASPTTSGSEETLDVRTGVPRAIASSGGKPNPSYTDGNAKASASR